MNITVWRFRRKLAYQESLALRALVRAHGYIPVCAPNTWEAW